MKPSLLSNAFLIATLCAALSLFTPAFGGDKDMLNQAQDLVHQAWNPAGDPPSISDQTDLLNQALKLVQDVSDHHLKGHRVQAIQDIKAALEELAKGDVDHKAVDFIHDADYELRTALSIMS